MTRRIPKLILFFNDSSHSYFLFKKPLHQKIGQWKKESSLYLYKLPLDTYPRSAAKNRQTLLSSQHTMFILSSLKDVSRSENKFGRFFKHNSFCLLSATDPE